MKIASILLGLTFACLQVHVSCQYEAIGGFPSISESPIMAPIVDDDTSEISDEPGHGFAPGRIVTSFLSPLRSLLDPVFAPMEPVSTPLARTTVNANCSGVQGIKCEDCNTLAVCFNAATPLYSTKCPPEAPYCSQYGCFPTASDESCEKQNTFYCSSEGFFPDPKNCSVFYFCPQALATASKILKYECPKHYHFNSRTKNCQRQILMLPRCKPMDCAKKIGDYVSYPQNNGYFGQCPPANSPTQSEITMFKCRDSDNMVFNLHTETCEFKCTREGFFEDTLNSKKYYFCYRDSRLRLSFLHETCPENYQYKTGKCVKSEKAGTNSML